MSRTLWVIFGGLLSRLDSVLVHESHLLSFDCFPSSLLSIISSINVQFLAWAGLFIWTKVIVWQSCHHSITVHITISSHRFGIHYSKQYVRCPTHLWPYWALDMGILKFKVYLYVSFFFWCFPTFCLPDDPLLCVYHSLPWPSLGCHHWPTCGLCSQQEWSDSHWQTHSVVSKKKRTHFGHIQNVFTVWYH